MSRISPTGLGRLGFKIAESVRDAKRANGEDPDITDTIEQILDHMQEEILRRIMLDFSVSDIVALDDIVELDGVPRGFVVDCLKLLNERIKSARAVDCLTSFVSEKIDRLWKAEELRKWAEDEAKIRDKRLNSVKAESLTGAPPWEEQYFPINPPLAAYENKIKSQPEIQTLDIDVKKSIPLVAPEKWTSKGKQERETPVEFIQRVYGRFLGSGLTRAHLLKLDKPLYNALAQHMRMHGKELPFDLPSKREVVDRQLSEVSDEDSMEKVKELERLAASMRRRLAEGRARPK